jgi:hypothetical protein|tara:strand:- start:809 stop:2971 length:2163 start_codon:yes stop_codon:yes gene_type:complete
MLQKINIQPGFNKQVTATGGEGQWIGGDYVRFRYATPEKVGGWAQLGDSTLTGRNTALHHFVNASGIKYAALGTNRFLYIYSGGAFYDITPIKATTTLTSAFTTTNGDATVTITFASDHNITKYDIVRLDNFSTITDSNFAASDFDDNNFMVATVPTSTTITIEMGSNESGSGASTSGGIRVQHFYSIGPAVEESAAGWGLGLWGGTVAGEVFNTLNGALTSGSSSIVLASSSSMPSSGTVLIDSERIAYTTNTTGTNTLSGLTRGADNTTAASHSDGATVTDASDYTKWGASQTGDIITAPGLWSLDNFGNKLIATIFDGATFEWNSDADSATSTRATIVANAPTAAVQTLVSTPDRHLVFFGTETTIGTTSTQDDMYIRWSDQESINASTSYTPSATNTAGTQRLADGTRIVAAIRGRDAIYVWTDTSLFIMRFVGAPFVFSFQQVGTNCGLIGKNAAVEVDGSAYWMSENGFFRYTGKLDSLACLVEDYVYDDMNTVPKQHIYAGLNNLFGEVTWFYPGSGAASNNRSVTYNYMDSTPERPVWTTSTLARSAWSDSHIFGKPHATEYDSSATSDTTVGNTDGVTVYYEHETGQDQIKAGARTGISASIESGDFDISATQGGGADLRGDGEHMMKIRRVLPDFLQQTGDARVTLNLKNYPTDSQASSSLGPFTTTTSTTKIDTRARARAISLKVDNTSTKQHWKLGTFRLDIQADGRR